MEEKFSQQFEQPDKEKSKFYSNKILMMAVIIAIIVLVLIIFFIAVRKTVTKSINPSVNSTDISSSIVNVEICSGKNEIDDACILIFMDIDADAECEQLESNLKDKCYYYSAGVKSREEYCSLIGDYILNDKCKRSVQSYYPGQPFP